MRSEVIEFYAANNIPVKRMIRAGVNRMGLTPESIESSAESVYEDIMSGKVIKPRLMAWEVFKRSTPTKIRAASMSELDANIQKCLTDIASVKSLLTKNKEDHLVNFITESVDSLNVKITKGIDELRIDNNAPHIEALQLSLKEMGERMTDYLTPWYMKLFRKIWRKDHE